MITIDFAKRSEEAAQFLIERAQAIDQYAGVEQSLSMLFSDLLGTSFELGGIRIFSYLERHVSQRHPRTASLKKIRRGLRSLLERHPWHATQTRSFHSTASATRASERNRSLAHRQQHPHGRHHSHSHTHFDTAKLLDIGHSTVIHNGGRHA